jgi:hypothetical protein
MNRTKRLMFSQQFSRLLFTLIVFLIGLSSARYDRVTTNECCLGPDFWCLNRTTEDRCNFTNTSIGVCGYSNRRCPIETGRSPTN